MMYPFPRNICLRCFSEKSIDSYSGSGTNFTFIAE